jgi:hypothetical protein
MIIIGLSGKKRSGKNTVAKLIATATSLRVKEFAFADPLKHEVCKACGISRTILEENKDNFRLILQGWGTDFRRKMHGDDYWIKKTGLALHTSVMSDQADIYVFTDLRFTNEANFLRDCGAVIVRVNRDLSTVDEHSSEVDLDGYRFDFVINNSSTLNNLASDVRMLLSNLHIKTK